MHTQTYIYIITCASIYTCKYVCMYMCIYMYIYICVCVYMCIYIYIIIYEWMCEFMHVWMSECRKVWMENVCKCTCICKGDGHLLPSLIIHLWPDSKHAYKSAHGCQSGWTSSSFLHLLHGVVAHCQYISMSYQCNHSIDDCQISSNIWNGFESLDWLKGKSTGNHGFYHQIVWAFL